MHYKAQFKVGGRLAQVGARLVAGVARKMDDDFFGKFILALDTAAEKVITEQDKIVAASSARRNRIFLAIAGGAAVVLIVLWLSLGN